MRIFLLKVKHFVKRNIYPITVTICTSLMIVIIAISAYTSIKSTEDKVTVVNTQKHVSEETEKESNDEKNESGGSENESQQTSSTETIIFDLPFSGATVSKQYAEDKLLYDKTTKYWCTHLGIDFASKEGQSVVAIFDGEIKKIESSMMNGTVVYLKISDSLTVVYKGLSSTLSVSEGEKVKKGQKIGTISSMLAEKADGTHLHLELLKNEKNIDPTEYFSLNK